MVEAPERDRLDEIETMLDRYKSIKRSDVVWLCSELRSFRASTEELGDRCDTLLGEVNILQAEKA